MAECRILVVDDDPLIVTTLTDILKNDGYQVDTAASALEAARTVARHAPAVVVLDIRMPGLDGVQFARTLRDREMPVRIVVLTAARDGRGAAAAINAEAFLAKPLDISDLLSQIRRLCDEAERERPRPTLLDGR